MSNEKSNSIQAKEKSEVTSPSEQTKTGPTFIPAVDIFETDNAITLIADMPGVKPDGIDIDLNENVLSLSGDVLPFEGKDEEDILVEFEIGRFWRQFTISEMIDQSKIDAELKEGVLHLTLPKIEKAQPRKITVKSS
jgi:HSP20 family molecular chaperone IbpA